MESNYNWILEEIDATTVFLDEFFALNPSPCIKASRGIVILAITRWNKETKDKKVLDPGKYQ